MKTLSPQRLVKRFGRSAIVLALVPLIFFAGLPQFGCICADGHFEQFCPVLREARAAARHHASNHATCCGCVGCRNAPGNKPCCPANKAPASPQTGQSCLNGVSGCCCTPAVHVPDAPIKANEVEGFSSFAVQPAMLAESPISPRADHDFNRAGENRAGPPVRDLVVVLHRLTI
jgi:hypothetical protein